MNTIRAKIGQNGRIIIPTSLRQKLQWSIGDNIILSISSNELSITTQQQVLSKLQMKVKSQMAKMNEDISLVDELIATRRMEGKEAGNENE